MAFRPRQPVLQFRTRSSYARIIIPIDTLKLESERKERHRNQYQNGNDSRAWKSPSWIRQRLATLVAF